MIVVASFKLNQQLENAIADLEHFGINRDNILALPLATIAEKEMIVSKQKLIFETAPILGTILMLLGAIYGFVVTMGPILLALAGLIVGMLLGGTFDYYRVKLRNTKGNGEDGKVSEVFLLIHCLNKDHAVIVKRKTVEASPEWSIIVYPKFARG